jgi:hypothetical protein
MMVFNFIKHYFLIKLIRKAVAVGWERVGVRYEILTRGMQKLVR